MSTILYKKFFRAICSPAVKKLPDFTSSSRQAWSLTMRRDFFNRVAKCMWMWKFTSNADQILHSIWITKAFERKGWNSINKVKYSTWGKPERSKINFRFTSFIYYFGCIYCNWIKLIGPLGYFELEVSYFLNTYAINCSVKIHSGSSTNATWTGIKLQ